MTLLTKPFVHLESPRNATKKMTLAEFLALPEGPPYYEFEDGELIEMVRPHSRHQKVSMRLSHPLDDYVTRGNLGSIWQEIEVLLPGHTRVYIPDIVFLSNDRLRLHHEDDGRIYGAPDLAIEVLSPSTRRRDRTRKMNVYQRAGVKWYWLVEQDDLTIEEFELTDRGYLATQLISPGVSFQPTLFPGLVINLAELMGEAVTNRDEETE